jgi:hypothetical protein
MTYSRKLIAQIHRFGKTADVLVREESGQNEFGNIKDSHEFDRTIIAFQTYPNRNTDIDSNIGDRSQDRPVFLVPDTESDPEPPAVDSQLVYNGNKYEVKAHTRYDTHVEFFGEPVIHNENGQ